MYSKFWEPLAALIHDAIDSSVMNMLWINLCTHFKNCFYQDKLSEYVNMWMDAFGWSLNGSTQKCTHKKANVLGYREKGSFSLKFLKYYSVFITKKHELPNAPSPLMLFALLGLGLLSEGCWSLPSEHDKSIYVVIWSELDFSSNFLSLCPEKVLHKGGWKFYVGWGPDIKWSFNTYSIMMTNCILWLCSEIQYSKHSSWIDLLWSIVCIMH